VHKDAKPHSLTEEDILRNNLYDLRSDTIDILNYDVEMDITNFSQQKISATTTVRFSPLMDGQDHINLDLEQLTVDSVYMNGVGLNYVHTGYNLFIPLDGTYDIGDVVEVSVEYNGSPIVDPGNFGGLDFNGGYAYVLGIGITSNPHNYGRSWHPCFDNFRERATYDFHIKHQANYSAVCVGTRLEPDTVASGAIISNFRMDQLIPTYLTSFAVADYAIAHDVHQGMEGPIPLEYAAKPGDTTAMKNAFEFIQ